MWHIAPPVHLEQTHLVLDLSPCECFIERSPHQNAPWQQNRHICLYTSSKWFCILRGKKFLSDTFFLTIFGFLLPMPLTKYTSSAKYKKENSRCDIHHQMSTHCFQWSTYPSLIFAIFSFGKGLVSNVNSGVNELTHWGLKSGQQSADNIFKCILRKKIVLLIQISLKFHQMKISHYWFRSVHETSSSPFAQFDLILGWITWKWLWATWNYNEMLKQPICERIGHGWRFHALSGIGLTLHKWQAVTWTNDDHDHWVHIASLGHNEFNHLTPMRTNVPKASIKTMNK